jgi:hypothetical protein
MDVHEARPARAIEPANLRQDNPNNQSLGKIVTASADSGNGCKTPQGHEGFGLDH